MRIFCGVLVFLCLHSLTEACGGFFCRPLQPVVQSAETIAFGVEQQNDDTVAVTMQVQIQYDGPTESFSWILPLPALPDVSVGTDALFARLMEATNPTVRLDIRTSTLDDDPFANPCTPPTCFASTAAGVFPESANFDDASVAVLDSGSVGPFDFVIIEAVDENDNDAAYRWLNDNGYDQPEGSGPLLNYYASMDMKFLALKLSKNNDAGDIQPIILRYDLPGDIVNDALACVPIKLTAVAAADALPVQVFLLGPQRAVPVNYLEAEMDLELADWLGCGNSPNCFLNDHRARANAMFQQLQGKAFTTEYAADTSTLMDQVRLDIDLEQYESLETAEEYLGAMSIDNVPYTNQVHGIVSDFIEGVTRPDAGSFCLGQTFTFPPSSTRVCLDIGLVPTTENETVPVLFDAVGLTEALDSKVYQVLREDEEWMLSHSKITRMYGNFAGPGDMTKDPFFAFSDLPDVSNQFRASGVVSCSDDSGSFGNPRGTMNFTIASGSVSAEEEALSFALPVENSCGVWRRLDPSEALFSPTAPTARKLVAQGFGAEITARTVEIVDGEINLDDLALVEGILDGRVPNQTVPDWEAAAVSTAPMANTTNLPQTENNTGLPPTDETTSATPQMSPTVAVALLGVIAATMLF